MTQQASRHLVLGEIGNGGFVPLLELVLHELADLVEILAVL